MAKKNKQTKKQDKDLATELQESARKVFLAGLGALSAAEDEGSKLFKELVKRGKKYTGPGAKQVETLVTEVETQLKKAQGQVESVVDAAKKQADKAADSAKKQVDAVTGTAKKQTERATETVENSVEDIVTTVLHRIGIPTREEIDDLTRSVERLSRNVNRLKRDRKAEEDEYEQELAKAEAKILAAEKEVEKAETKAAKTKQRAAKKVEAATAVESKHVGGGWYEISVGGTVVEKVQGKDAAAEAVTRLEV
jgi:poly(hydroxyalkanoate) granule-associated protein